VTTRSPAPPIESIMVRLLSRRVLPVAKCRGILPLENVILIMPRLSRRASVPSGVISGCIASVTRDCRRVPMVREA
jgi:hypothetical protein